MIKISKIIEKDEQGSQSLYIMGWCAIGAFILLGIFLHITGLNLSQVLGQCMFYRMSGLYCPGCGGTRAARALFAGDIVASFKYHPLVPLAAVLGAWFMISQTLERISKGKIRIAMHFREVYIWIVLAIILINVLVKDMALVVWGVDLMAF